jgi:hypothetical protein
MSSSSTVDVTTNHFAGKNVKFYPIEIKLKQFSAPTSRHNSQQQQ